jgi:phytoene dehydrogenase-like protein
LEGLRGEYDVIVVGSGLAGLSAAYRLANRGFSVLVLEQHRKIGGLATYFRRPGGIIFDVSLHGFPGAMIKSCRRYFGEEIAEHIVRLPQIRLENPQFSLRTTFDHEDVARILTRKFDVPSRAVAEFLHSVLRRNFFDPSRQTVGEFLEEFFPSQPEVHRFLLEPICYANGTSLDDPAITFAVVFGNFIRQGVFIFRGGADLLLRLLRARLIGVDVDIRVGIKVEKILVEKGRARGIIAKGRKIRAQAVVSNAHLLETIFHLVGEDILDEPFLTQARRVRPNCSSTQVYIAFQSGYEPPREEMGDLVFRSRDVSFSPEKLLQFNSGNRTYTFYYSDFRPGHGRSYVVASSNARYEDWATLGPERYALAKQELIRETLEDLALMLPGIKERIAWVEAATPLTIARFTAHPQGASFGTKYEGLTVSRALPQQVAGLFHAGSVGILMSGYLGTINYGVLVAHEVEAFLKQGTDWLQPAAGIESALGGES